MTNIDRLSNKYREDIFNLVKKVYKPKSKITLCLVDFESPWWQLFLKKPLAFGSLIVSKTFQSAFYALTPLLIGIVVSRGK